MASCRKPVFLSCSNVNAASPSIYAILSPLPMASYPNSIFLSHGKQLAACPSMYAILSPRIYGQLQGFFVPPGRTRGDVRTTSRKSLENPFFASYGKRIAACLSNHTILGPCQWLATQSRSFLLAGPYFLHQYEPLPIARYPNPIFLTASSL